MLELKSGVRLDNLCPQIVLALQVASGAWRDAWIDHDFKQSRADMPTRKRGAAPVTYYHPLVVTSINDGKHSRTSLHHIGHAVDLRTKSLPSAVAKRWFVAEVRRRVGVEFDVILEGLGTTNEHCHLEYQPKRPYTHEHIVRS